MQRIKTLKNFSRRDEGTVAILFALVAIVVTSITGLAIDMGRAVDARSQLQLAADAAALAAAAKSNLNEAERIDLAKRVFRANRDSNSLVANVEPIVTLTGAGDSAEIKIDAGIDLPTTFSGVAGVSSFALNVSATALMGSTGSEGDNGPACLLALEANDYGIKINGGGSGSHLTTNCNVHVNSASSSAIFGNSKGSIASSKTCVKGNYDNDPTYAPTPITNCKVLGDPLAGVLPPPQTAGCNYNNTKVNANRSGVIYPGIHCGGIDIGSRANVTFDPGVYVIKNGQFNVSSSATVTGNGVFFYLTGNNARISFGSSAQITLRAPTSGDYKGVLVWAAEALSNAHRVGSHANTILQGTIYSPGTEFDIQSSGTIGANGDWTIWVVKQLQMSSHATLDIRSNYAGSETPTPDGLLERLQLPSRVARLK